MKIKIAKKFYRRLVGLMFMNSSDYSLYIPKCNKIHTFFMKFSLDLIIIDENNIIIDIKKNIPKNKIIVIKRKKKKTNILEVPNNISHNYKINNLITFD